MKNYIIILAGGSGVRFGMMKQFVPINGKPVFCYTIEKFKKYSIFLTVPQNCIDIVNNIIKHYNYKNITVVCGGETRQESVFNALREIDPSSTNELEHNVIITDANRPCISSSTILKCIQQLKKFKSVAVVSKSINTSCVLDKNQLIKQTLDRTNQYDLLMPQGFKFWYLLYAHKHTPLRNCTDDTEILKSVYPQYKTAIVETSFWEGLKLTYPSDYKIFELLLQEK